MSQACCAARSLFVVSKLASRWNASLVSIAHVLRPCLLACVTGESASGKSSLVSMFTSKGQKFPKTYSMVSEAAQCQSSYTGRSLPVRR